MVRPSFVLAFAMLTAASVCASAQWTVSKVTFRNPGTRSQAALEQAVGMHVGDKATRAQIQAAAQRLMDSGYFDNVKVDSKGAPGSMEVVFILYPNAAAKETPAGFDNFVWFTPEELQGVISKAAPLFNGRLPQSGNETDVINAALQTAVVAKGVTGRVTNDELPPSSVRPFTVANFRVEPGPRVATAHIASVPPELAQAEDTAIAKLIFTPYSEGAAEDTTADALLSPARNAGYLDAKLDGFQRSLNASGQVEVSAALVAGEVYHVSALNLPAADAQQSSMQSANVLRVGDAASRDRLLNTLAPVEVAYRKQGYMDVYVKAGETRDAAAHTVSYTPVVVAGGVYHLRSVKPTGLTPSALADFNNAWHMRVGDVYDADYVSHFIENNSSLRAISTYKATFKAEADPDKHLVDLTITFEPSGIQARP